MTSKLLPLDYFVPGQDWVDYDDEDDAYDTSTVTWKRELIEVSPSTSPAAGNAYGAGIPGGYGGAGRGSPLPYGPPLGGTASPSPAGILSPPPPPPPKAATASYSTSATVPGVKSTATLNAYADVAAFNATERLRFTTALQDNIFILLKTLANVTITSVTPGSVNVDNTIAFTGADIAEASSSAAALVTALNSGDASIFGTSFGTVQVSGVSAANATNPAAYDGSTGSGASSTQWALLPVVIAVLVIAVATMTLVHTSF